MISILEICEKSELNYFKYSMNGEELSFQKGVLKESDVKYESQSVATKESIDIEKLVQENTDILALDKKPGRHAAGSSGSMEGTEYVIVKSNFVGAFSVADSLKGGKKEVNKGSVLGVIEAMKVYNDVIAPVDGIVEEIMAADGSLVECDQELLSIKVSG
ncbi:biotin/lipoyl-containing protein [Anaerocolumna sp. AGMB13020]|uniref:acetyl-CoA carboxylase biotin carboxyl carrier protein n=1 Tax=Anaerocolumna sp. AGMB13020 TaxID=3081750 RepID=UPI00295473CE|nr:biotin/lipoyl-containing protein [Anaerocolumna sp. AGMB13020]WOO37941.1 biotin/lipoyl-containing protein [Anaerocolumna sp. AGMB13020]